MSEFFSKYLSALSSGLAADPLFFIFGLLIFLSALFVVLQKDLVRAGFSLIICFGLLALVYFALGAELAAISQILIYAVGITLLIVFAIMLLAGSMDKDEAGENTSLQKISKHFMAGSVALMLFVSLSIGIMGITTSLTPIPPMPEARIVQIINDVFNARQQVNAVPSIETLSQILLTDQILAFELVSVLLLIAFISAIVLSRKTS
jgi:NADH:ubiquinone oxidoreductase subunit 6 (subunit J)